MGSWDRLDAADRRVGLAPKPLRKPPSRVTRWVAAHPWLWACVYAAPWIVFWLVRLALGQAGIVWMLCPLTVVPFGYLQAVQTRRQLEQWETEHPVARENAEGSPDALNDSLPVWLGVVAGSLSSVPDDSRLARQDDTCRRRGDAEGNAAPIDVKVFRDSSSRVGRSRIRQRGRRLEPQAGPRRPAPTCACRSA
jgi:hypothetical protein